MTDCHSTLKRKEVLTPASTGPDLKDMRLREMSQAEKDKNCVIPPIRGLLVVRFVEAERWTAGTGGLGEGEWGVSV